jgi:hypothetical protein
LKKLQWISLELINVVTLKQRGKRFPLYLPTLSVPFALSLSKGRTALNYSNFRPDNAAAICAHINNFGSGHVITTASG